MTPRIMLPCDQWELDAAAKVAALLAKPMPKDQHELGGSEFFDPWDLFPIYGSYSREFDNCAIEVLRELATGVKKRDDLGAEMFREMLCYMHLCDYGSSPRVSFPTGEFKPHLLNLINRWEQFREISWKEML